MHSPSFANKVYFENFVAMMDRSVMLLMKGFRIQLPKILATLTTIDFSVDNFEGEIPQSIGKLKPLKDLSFSRKETS